MQAPPGSSFIYSLSPPTSVCKEVRELSNLPQTPQLTCLSACSARAPPPTFVHSSALGLTPHPSANPESQVLAVSGQLPFLYHILF